MWRRRPPCCTTAVSDRRYLWSGCFAKQVSQIWPGRISCQIEERTDAKSRSPTHHLNLGQTRHTCEVRNLKTLSTYKRNLFPFSNGVLLILFFSCYFDHCCNFLAFLSSRPTSEVIHDTAAASNSLFHRSRLADKGRPNAAQPLLTEF